MTSRNKTLRDLQTGIEIAHYKVHSVYLEHYQGFSIIYYNKESLFSIDFTKLNELRSQIEDEMLLKHLEVYVGFMQDIVQQNEQITEFWADLMRTDLDERGRKKLYKLLYDRLYLSENYNSLWKLVKFKEGIHEIKAKAQEQWENLEFAKHNIDEYIEIALLQN